jgi:hypothetical protein
MKPKGEKPKGENPKGEKGEYIGITGVIEILGLES